MLTTWSWCRSHNLKGVGPNRTTPTSDVSCKGDLQASLVSPDQLATNPRGSHDPLRFDNSLEWLRTQEGIMIIVLKNINPGPCMWRDQEGEVWEDSECWASIPISCGIWVSPTLNLNVFTNQEVPLSWLVTGFSLCRHDWIIEFTHMASLQPPPPPKNGLAHSPSPQITWLVLCSVPNLCRLIS